MDSGSFLVVAFLGLCILMAVASRRIVQPKVIKLSGTIPPVSEWLEAALVKAASWSGTPWTHDVFEVSDEDGNPTHYLGVLKNREGIDELHVKTPLHDEVRVFDKTQGFPVIISMESYSYRRAWQYRLLLGKYPLNHVLRARTRLMQQVRRQSRKAAKSLA